MRLPALYLGLALAASAPAHALLFRAYLAAAGSDTNPCTLQQPCRLLPAALAAVADGGEVWMLDSANYNVATVNVAKSVTILAVPGVVGSVVAAGGSAIAVATPGAEVVLRNLVIVPLAGAGATDGIHVTSAAILAVEGCVIANLPGTGVRVEGPAQVRITNCTLRNNGADGILVANGARATITRAVLSGNGGDGVRLSGTAGATTTTADVADSTLDGNVHGLRALSGDASAVLRASVAESRVVRNTVGILARSDAGASVTLSASGNLVSNNADTGVGAHSSGAKVWATTNSISANGVGLRNTGAVFATACDNDVRNNLVADGIGTINAGLDCGGPYNRTFVTSTTHPATLGSVSAYDAICNARATEAGLNNPLGTGFIAWISSSNSDARARLGGTPRGWVRTDGKPFADTVSTLVAGRVYYPQALDEHGTPVPANSEVYTGTNADGTASGWHCSNWTGSGPATIGYTSAGTPSWTAMSAISCATPRRLLCFGKLYNKVITVAAQPGRKAFVTSGTLSPGPGVGFAAADALCQSEASQAGLSGTFAALLAGAGTSAASRFNLLGTPWVRRDGIPLVDSAADLASTGFAVTLSILANNAVLGSTAIAWTGAATFSQPGSATSTCEAWTSGSSGPADAMIVDRLGVASSNACSTPLRLFCLEQ